MDLECAITVIESVSGFTEQDTPVGEAWFVVLAEITRLRTELAVAQMEGKAAGLMALQWSEQLDRAEAQRDTLRQQLAVAREGLEQITGKHKGELRNSAKIARDTLAKLEKPDA